MTVLSLGGLLALAFLSGGNGHASTGGLNDPAAAGDTAVPTPTPTPKPKFQTEQAADGADSAQSAQSGAVTTASGAKAVQKLGHDLVKGAGQLTRPFVTKTIERALHVGDIEAVAEQTGLTRLTDRVAGLRTGRPQAGLRDPDAGKGTPGGAQDRTASAADRTPDASARAAVQGPRRDTPDWTSAVHALTTAADGSDQDQDQDGGEDGDGDPVHCRRPSKGLGGPGLAGLS